MNGKGKRERERKGKDRERKGRLLGASSVVFLLKESGVQRNTFRSFYAFPAAALGTV